MDWTSGSVISPRMLQDTIAMYNDCELNSGIGYFHNLGMRAYDDDNFREFVEFCRTIARFLA